MIPALRTKPGAKAALTARWVSPPVWDGARAALQGRAAPDAVVLRPEGGAGHPLADAAVAAELDRREAEIGRGFDRLPEILKALAPRQFDRDFAERAVAELASIGIAAQAEWFAADWIRPLDLGAVHARCVTRQFARMVDTGSERLRHASSDGEPVEELVRRWGFHAIDITPCADGRMAGLLGSVLRVPLAVVTARRSHAGAMFAVQAALRDWERVELGRLRAAAAGEGEGETRYLKIGVYHFSRLDPGHHGCAAHGSDDAKAIGGLLERLVQFRAAVEARHGAGDRVAVLLIGVDTDTDAIRVHVPDAGGTMRPGRFVDSHSLHRSTRELSREAAKDAVRRAVAEAMEVAEDDAATEGMRWFCGYLLKNNIAQVEAVQRRFKGPHPEPGHAERFIVIGDPIDDVQLRNLAFQAQMSSVEEGAVDLSVGVGILGQRLWPQGLAVPVLVLRHFDRDLPGDEAVAGEAALRMAEAVAARFTTGRLSVEAATRASDGGGLRFLDGQGAGAVPACMRCGRVAP